MVFLKITSLILIKYVILVLFIGTKCKKYVKNKSYNIYEN